MIDVSEKFNTLRRAMAEGYLSCKPETRQIVLEKTIPQEDGFEVARAAGITEAKRCSDMIVFCLDLMMKGKCHGK